MPILRAGLGMVPGLLALAPTAKVGHIGLSRNEETYKAVEYFCKLPKSIEERTIVVPPLGAKLFSPTVRYNRKGQLRPNGFGVGYMEVTMFNTGLSSGVFTNRYNNAYGNGEGNYAPGSSFAGKSVSKNVVSSNRNNSFDNYPRNKPDTSQKDIKRLLDCLKKGGQSDYKIVNGKKVFSATMKDKENGFLQLAGASIEKDLEAAKSAPKYKYKEVSAKIRQAKTSASASQALLAAKRNVLDLKRQLRNNKEGADEILLALSHARRMEMAARKKKNHIETEELIENTRKLDERMEQEEDVASGGFSEQEIRSAVVGEAEDEITELEDDIFEQKQDLMDDLSEEVEATAEEGGEISEDMMADLAAMIAEFGEEELKSLEENMEMLEDIEVIDPHMSEDDFKKLKTKHRQSEEKIIVKADMEYLKEMIELYEKKESAAGALPGNGTASASSAMPAMPAISPPVPSEPAGFDVVV